MKNLTSLSILRNPEVSMKHMFIDEKTSMLGKPDG